MTRYDIVFGQNYLDMAFAGLGDTAQIKCDISLNNTKLDTLLSEHNGTNYMLYDVQDLVPRGEAIALPIFHNGYAIYENFIKTLELKYYNATKSQTISKKIIPNSGVNGYQWTGSIGQFLTKQPIAQKTNFRASEWLWFLMNFNERTENISLKISVKTTGKQVIEKSIALAGNLTDKLICIDISAEFVATTFGEIDKKYIESYDIWLINGTERISEIREYHIANSSAYDVEMIVLNSFGVWDTLSLVAGQKSTKEIETQYSENRRKVQIEASNWIDKYLFSITDLEQGWLKYLIEIIISRSVFLRNGSELLPIICTTKSYDDAYNTKVQDEANLEFRGQAIERTVKL